MLDTVYVLRPIQVHNVDTVFTGYHRFHAVTVFPVGVRVSHCDPTVALLPLLHPKQPPQQQRPTRKS